MIRISSTSKTRPADTTAYAAKDIVAESTSAGTVWTFSEVARYNANGGYLVRASLLTSQTTNTETFKLHLFNAAPTAINDNAQCTAPLYANAGSYVGTIVFPSAATEGTGGTAAYANATPNTIGANLPLPFVAAGGDRALYGLLEVAIGFTPASAQTFSIVLEAASE